MKRLVMGGVAIAALGILATGCNASWSADGHHGNVNVNNGNGNGNSGQSAAGGGNNGGSNTGTGGGGAGGSAGSTSTPRCHTSDLHATITGFDAGAGQRYARLVFQNVSGHACRMYGWPGMGLGHGTASISTNVVRQGTPTSFVIIPNGHAHARLHWTVVPSGDEPTSGSCEPTPSWIYVTPPNETTQLQIPWTSGSVCDHGRIEVQALVAGPGA
jgi:hypothetical protein